LTAGSEHSVSSRVGGGGGINESFGVRRFLQWSSAANFVVVLASLACIDIISTIISVGTANALSFASLARFLELWWDDELTFHIGIIACSAWIFKSFTGDGAIIVTQLEASFATSALRMTCQII
jgi:hypothetical protein